MTNAKALAEGLMKRGHKLMTNGTSNHLLLWDLRPKKVSGNKMEKLCEAVHITVNKNSIAGDKSGVVSGGVRIGTPAMTTRGCSIKDMDKIAELLDKTTNLAIEI